MGAGCTVTLDEISFDTNTEQYRSATLFIFSTTTKRLVYTILQHRQKSEVNAE